MQDCFNSKVIMHCHYLGDNGLSFNARAALRHDSIFDAIREI
jgi:hypothetical protein